MLKLVAYSTNLTRFTLRGDVIAVGTQLGVGGERVRKGKRGRTKNRTIYDDVIGICSRRVVVDVVSEKRYIEERDTVKLLLRICRAP